MSQVDSPPSTPSSSSASGVEAALNGHCTLCGSLVVHLCCNGPMAAWIKALNPDGLDAYDYWAYCSNKACPHQHGDGYGGGNGSPWWVR